ncbi:hypothetical protein LEP1GSC060_0550 [Leptospira weilii serovar Ranarum str. ICFT]|uniref:Uncharacterized protein n=1 Tax=Leptospira weilii serovar Ranarum str. ICFT TaxID=1218598 RepID=N1WNB3_9LEPT|nr:hypothetical protein LEP1GSC060_0550 [Leptospira weilii serovar Ranarum str. ICFT]
MERQKKRGWIRPNFLKPNSHRLSSIPSFRKQPARANDSFHFNGTFPISKSCLCRFSFKSLTRTILPFNFSILG